MLQLDMCARSLTRPLRDRRRALTAAAFLFALPLGGCQTAPTTPEEVPFPAVGRRLLVTFPTFRTELHFHSVASLTWYFVNADGSRGRTEQVDTRVQPVGDRLYLVTWQEANKTTVVQVHDFVRRVIFTNVTRRDGSFLQARGTFVELSEP